MGSINQSGEQKALMVLVWASSLAALYYNLLPLIQVVLQGQDSMNAERAGVIESAFFLGFILASLSAFSWIRKLDWPRAIRLCALLSVVAFLAMTLSDEFWYLATLTTVAGAASGALYSIGSTGIGDSVRATRWYGIKLTGEALLGALALVLFPLLVEEEKLVLLIPVGIALLFCSLWPLAPGINAPTRVGAVPGIERGPIALNELLATWMCLITLALFMFASTVIWVQLEVLIIELGANPVEAGELLSLTLLTGLAGSMLAIFLEDRLGKFLPVFLAIIIFIVGTWCLSSAESVLLFELCALLVTFAIALGLAYLVALLAAIDGDGRYVAIGTSAIGLGIVLAPAVAGSVVARLGLAYILPLTVVAMTLVGLLLLAIAMIRRSPDGN